MLSPQLKQSRGFTLIEILVVLAITAFLAAMSYPSYANHVRKAKRVAAIAQLTIIEQVEERWRSEHLTYGDLSDIRMTQQSAGEGYQLSFSSVSANAYTATAQAQGSQDGDTQCRYMRLIVTVNSSVTASGPDNSASNDFLANSRCWLK
jgi:type IV pilus assembly protein PilE